MKIIERKAVSSNLKIILAPMVGAKTMTGIFAVRAGLRYENRKNNGIAHFFEHMAFKGTKKYPTFLDIAKEIDGRGGKYNAFTSSEITCYWVKLFPDHLEIICDILSDMLLDSIFDPLEIEKEKGIIIQEIRMIHDSPEGHVSELSSRLLYGDQPAGWSVLGTEESVKALERNDFLEFLESLYTDENAFFCLAGRIPDVDHAFTKINNLFFGIREGEPKISKLPVIEDQKEPAILIDARDILQSQIVLGVRAYGIFHPKRYAFSILNTILGGNTCSRLFTEIREKRSLAYGVASFISRHADIGNLRIWAGVDRERTEEAIKVIIDECRRICEVRVSEEELQLAKDYVVGSLQIDLESSDDIASSLISQRVLEGEIIPLSKRIKKIQAITAEDVQEVAQDIFVNKGLNLAIVGPHQGMEEKFLKILKF